jgi:hypothetical protein
VTTSTGVFVFAGAATGLMGALNPIVTGVVLKLEASKTAEIDSRATERAIWSAQAWVELFCCFFIQLFGLNQFSCFSARFTGLRIAEISRQIGEIPSAVPASERQEYTWAGCSIYYTLV